MSERGRRRRRLVANLAFAILFMAACAAWFITLRPAPLGGPATYVIVRGVSMEPTYHAGDLVIVRRRPVYQAGDIVAYKIPAGEVGGGLSVIHRIVGGSVETGFRTKGDNNAESDPWRPTPGRSREPRGWSFPRRAPSCRASALPSRWRRLQRRRPSPWSSTGRAVQEEPEHRGRAGQRTAERGSQRRIRATSSTRSGSGLIPAKARATACSSIQACALERSPRASRP